MIRHTLRRLRRLLDRRAPMFYGQRLVLDPVRRRAVARWLARRRPHSAVLASHAPAAAAAAALERDGFHVLAAPLQAGQLDDIAAHLARWRCRDPYRPELGDIDPIASVPSATHVAFYPPEAVVSAPHVIALANDPFILAIVENLFGCKPTIGYLAAWWSFKGHAEGEQAELFHRDVDDWRFLKLFIYLTDVDGAAGPHVYVPGSQTVPKLLRIGRYSDAAVTAAFGVDVVHRFEGPRGTAFLEDTFGLHRGLPPRNRNRLVLQVVYSLGELPYGPRRPFDARELGPDALAHCGRDPYVNRVYLHGPAAP